MTALRAVSARTSWLTPLAVLVPILATLIGTLWAVTVFPPLALLVVVGGLAVTAFSGRHTYGVRSSLVAASLTLVAGVVAFFLSFAVLDSTSICGKVVPDRWLWVPPTGGALVYFALGSFGFRTGRASAVVPLAYLGGVVTIFLLVAALPGTQGVCDP